MRSTPSSAYPPPADRARLAALLLDQEAGQATRRGGTVVTTGCTEWVRGLAGRDRQVERITRNILDRLAKYKLLPNGESQILTSLGMTTGLCSPQRPNASPRLARGSFLVTGSASAVPNRTSPFPVLRGR
jgi:hypothetical protein